MKTIQQWLDEYGASHKNHTNKTIHWVCVPLIFFSVMGLIWSIPFPWELKLLGFQFNWAVFTTILVFGYYMALSFPLSIGMFLFDSACLFLWHVINQYTLLVMNNAVYVWQISITIFVLAWIGQFYGHKIEGKKPSFLKDLQFLMIGPAWLMSFIYTRLGIKY